MGGRLVEHVAVQHHIGAVRLGGVHFQRGRNLRHADRRLGMTLARRIRDALRMVAGGRGDDAAGDLLLGKRRDLVVRATNLERTGHLQVLRLEQNLMPGQLRQGARGNDLSVTRGAFQTLGGELQLGRVVTLQCLKDVFLFHTAYCMRRPAERTRPSHLRLPQSRRPVGGLAGKQLHVFISRLRCEAPFVAGRLMYDGLDGRRNIIYCHGIACFLRKERNNPHTGPAIIVVRRRSR